MIRRVLVLWAAAMAAGWAATPVAAQTRPPGIDEAPQGTFALTALTPVVLPGGQLDATVAISSTVPPEELEVAFRIGPALTSRSAFEQAVAGNPPSTALAFTTREVTAGPVGLQAVLSVQVTATGRNTPESFALARPGVYPLTITLRGAGGGEEVASAVTFVVRGSTDPPSAPFYVSWIWPVHAPPPATPGGSQETLRAELAPGGRLRTLARAAAGSPVTLSLWPVPATVDAIANLARDDLDAAAVLDDLGRAASAHSVIGGPYSLVFTDAWGLMPGELPPQLAAGAVSTTVALDVEAGSPVAVAVGNRPTSNDLARLTQAQGARILVVADDAVAAPDRKESLARPFEIRGVPGVSVLRADAALAADLADSGGPVAAGQRLIADLTLLAQDSSGGPRGAVIRPDPSWAPSAAALAEATARLAAAPHLSVTTVAQMATVVPAATEDGRRAGDPLVVDTIATEAEVPEEAASQYTAVASARAVAAQLAALVWPGTEKPPAILDEVAELLLLAPDVALVATGASADYSAAVEAQYRSVADGLTVPTDSSLTLTAEQGKVPVTVRNDSAHTATVRVEVVPEVAVRTVGPDAQVVTVEAGRSHTVEFEVAAAGAGTFRLLLRLTPPGGGDVISESSIELRATGRSWVATALTVGSLAFLALWWAWHAWSAKRGGKHAAARRVHPAGGGLDRPARDEADDRTPARAR